MSVYQNCKDEGVKNETSLSEEESLSPADLNEDNFIKQDKIAPKCNECENNDTIKTSVELDNSKEMESPCPADLIEDNFIKQDKIASKCNENNDTVKTKGNTTSVELDSFKGMESPCPAELIEDNCIKQDKIASKCNENKDTVKTTGNRTSVELDNSKGMESPCPADLIEDNLINQDKIASKCNENKDTVKTKGNKTSVELDNSKGMNFVNCEREPKEHTFNIPEKVDTYTAMTKKEDAIVNEESRLIMSLDQEDDMDSEISESFSNYKETSPHCKMFVDDNAETNQNESRVQEYKGIIKSKSKETMESDYKELDKNVSFSDPIASYRYFEINPDEYQKSPKRHKESIEIGGMKLSRRSYNKLGHKMYSVRDGKLIITDPLTNQQTELIPRTQKQHHAVRLLQLEQQRRKTFLSRLSSAQEDLKKQEIPSMPDDTYEIDSLKPSLFADESILKIMSELATYQEDEWNIEMSDNLLPKQTLDEVASRPQTRRENCGMSLESMNMFESYLSKLESLDENCDNISSCRIQRESHNIKEITETLSSFTTKVPMKFAVCNNMKTESSFSESSKPLIHNLSYMKSNVKRSPLNRSIVRPNPAWRHLNMRSSITDTEEDNMDKPLLRISEIKTEKIEDPKLFYTGTNKTVDNKLTQSPSFKCSTYEFTPNKIRRINYSTSEKEIQNEMVKNENLNILKQRVTAVVDNIRSSMIQTTLQQNLLNNTTASAPAMHTSLPARVTYSMNNSSLRSTTIVTKCTKPTAIFAPRVNTIPMVAPRLIMAPSVVTTHMVSPRLSINEQGSRFPSASTLNPFNTQPISAVSLNLKSQDLQSIHAVTRSLNINQNQVNIQRSTMQTPPFNVHKPRMATTVNIHRPQTKEHVEYPHINIRQSIQHEEKPVLPPSENNIRQPHINSVQLNPQFYVKANLTSNSKVCDSKLTSPSIVSNYDKQQVNRGTTTKIDERITHITTPNHTYANPISAERTIAQLQEKDKRLKFGLTEGSASPQPTNSLSSPSKSQDDNEKSLSLMNQSILKEQPSFKRPFPVTTMKTIIAEPKFNLQNVNAVASREVLNHVNLHPNISQSEVHSLNNRKDTVEENKAVLKPMNLFTSPRKLVAPSGIEITNQPQIPRVQSTIINQGTSETRIPPIRDSIIYTEAPMRVTEARQMIRPNSMLRTPDSTTMTLSSAPSRNSIIPAVILKLSGRTKHIKKEFEKGLNNRNFRGSYTNKANFNLSNSPVQINEVTYTRPEIRNFSRLAGEETLELAIKQVGIANENIELFGENDWRSNTVQRKIDNTSSCTSEMDTNGKVNSEMSGIKSRSTFDQTDEITSNLENYRQTSHSVSEISNNKTETISQNTNDSDRMIKAIEVIQTNRHSMRDVNDVTNKAGNSMNQDINKFTHTAGVERNGRNIGFNITRNNYKENETFKIQNNVVNDANKEELAKNLLSGDVKTADVHNQECRLPVKQNETNSQHSDDVYNDFCDISSIDCNYLDVLNRIHTENKQISHQTGGNNDVIDLSVSKQLTVPDDGDGNSVLSDEHTKYPGTRSKLSSYISLRNSEKEILEIHPPAESLKPVQNIDWHAEWKVSNEKNSNYADKVKLLEDLNSELSNKYHSIHEQFKEKTELVNNLEILLTERKVVFEKDTNSANVKLQEKDVLIEELTQKLAEAEAEKATLTEENQTKECEKCSELERCIQSPQVTKLMNLLSGAQKEASEPDYAEPGCSYQSDAVGRKRKATTPTDDNIENKEKKPRMEVSPLSESGPFSIENKNIQVELVRGSGVYMSKTALCTSKLKARDSATMMMRYMLDTFFTLEKLAGSSAAGRGHAKRPPLDSNITTTLITYIKEQFAGTTDGDMLQAINQKCTDARKVLKKRNRGNTSES